MGHSQVTTIRTRLPGLLFAALYATTAVAADVHVRLADNQGAALDGAPVALYRANGAGTATTPVEHVIDQVNKQFAPRLLTITAGDSIRFPNSDDIRHHVYSFSKANTFELPLYHGIPADPVSFPAAGRVAIGCNIHDRMSAYVYVVDSPWHGLTQNGQVDFADVPPGEYELVFAHPEDVPETEQRQRRTIDASSPVTIAVSVAPPVQSPANENSLTPLEQKFEALRRGKQ